MRTAASIRVVTALPGPRKIVRLELYRRVRDHAGGIGLTADRGIGRRLIATAGYASVDPRFPPLNGDRYGQGRRVFGGATVSITPALSASAFLTQAFHSTVPNPTARRWEVLLGYNVLAAVAHAR